MMSGLQIKQPQVLHLMRAICFCPYNKTLQNFESILNEPPLNPNQNVMKRSAAGIFLSRFLWGNSQIVYLHAPTALF